MRRAAFTKSKNKNKDRQRDDAPAPTAAPLASAAVAASPITAVEALLRDESFQPHRHNLLNPAVPVPNQGPGPVSLSVSVTANHAAPDADIHSQSQLGHDRQLLHTATHSSHVVSTSVLDAPMTDAFPAEANAISATAAATAATNTTSSTIATATSPTTFTTSAVADHFHQSGDSDDQSTASIAPSTANTLTCNTEPIESDPDDDIDLDLDASVSPALLNDLSLLASHADLDHDYVPHYYDYDDEDYDLDMSDSEGGAPLDDEPNYVPQLQVDQHHSALPQEDDDTQTTPTGPVNYFLHSFVHAPSVGSAGLIMNTAPPTEPWAPVPPNASVPMPQTIPQPPLPPLDPLDGPAPVSNPNPTMLGSENLGLVDFLRHWAYQARTASPLSLSRTHAPCPEEIRRQAHHHVGEIRYDHLHGDDFDMQGIDWASMGTTRRFARQRRCATYKNYVNKEGSDRWSPHMVDVNIASPESFLRFRKYIVRQDVYLAHFQLRSILACPSRTQAYYPGMRGVNRINPVSGKTELALNNSDVTGLGALISTLDANHGVLLAGTFNGEYYLKNLDSEDKKLWTDGQITQSMGGITNHVQIHMARRSSGPVAAISSNDDGFRVMDLATEKFVMQTRYRFPLNCSRISPDGRLRVMVGDDFKVLITDADTGQIQQELAGHRDYGFACDWSDDGYTVATGFQDKGVKIWDARRWCDSRGISTPLCTIRSEMAGVRNLRFSPVGSGERVLVAAEEADFVNIINAQTFSTKQTVDVFGEIGGVAFTNDGQDLNMLVSDHHRGGLLQLERCGVGPEPYFRNSWKRFTDLETDQWRYRVDERSHIGEAYCRRPISTDTIPIF
ncbi:hypothetical protein FDECE_6766 [Fusarium decemcellulare]|nr:hypothetical protein FDECE_6766 [Fusarium decemcellulare]